MVTKIETHLQYPLVALVIDTEKLAYLADIAKHTARGIPQSTDDEGDLVILIGPCSE